MLDLGLWVVGWRRSPQAIKLHAYVGTRCSFAPAVDSPLDFGPLGPSRAAPNLRAASGTPIARSLSLCGGGEAAHVTGQAAQAPQQHITRWAHRG
jgi:hypothetical protein